MKIYFAGSIRGGRDDQELYFSIIKRLRGYGVVLTEHIGDSQLTDDGELGRNNRDIFNRDMNWVKEADVMVAEVSTPSLGVGYELGQAESMNKKIICLHRTNLEKPLSAMVSGNSYPTILEYNVIDDIDKIFQTHFG